MPSTTGSAAAAALQRPHRQASPLKPERSQPGLGPSLGDGFKFKFSPLLLAVLLLPLLQPSAAQVSAAQRAAFVDLFTATAGPLWSAGAQAGWLVGDPCTGSWAGITCSSGTSVVR